MALQQHDRSRFRPATSGSQTITISTEEPLSPQIQSPPSGTLRLRAEGVSPQEDESERRHVQWAEDVVNNEGMGKKSSKVCCIYHKPRAVGDSSSDEYSSDSSSDDDSDTDPHDGAARLTNGHNHNHDHSHKDCDHGHDGKSRGQSKGKQKETKKAGSPNAYEKQPKVSSSKSTGL